MSDHTLLILICIAAAAVFLSLGPIVFWLVASLLSRDDRARAERFAKASRDEVDQ